MLKSFLILFSVLFFSGLSHAQNKNIFAKKPDTAVYYLNSGGRVVNTKDSAMYFLIILAPDTNMDKLLFRVNEYYKNGKVRLMGYSLTNDLDFKFQGTQIMFFSNGHKMSVANYDNGELVGDVNRYYPNGKYYCLKTYVKGKPVFFDQYNDSTGKVIMTGGNGKWKEYMDENFNKNYIEGEVAFGLQEGKWEGILFDSTKVSVEYNDGRLISSNLVAKPIIDNSATFTRVEIMPQFPQGLEAFYNYLAKSIRYPAIAHENNTQGKVIVQFIVEKDGSLTHFKILRSVGDGCDEEAIRILSSSPPWIPGVQNGKPVRVYYTVPISFSLVKE